MKKFGGSGLRRPRVEQLERRELLAVTVPHAALMTPQNSAPAIVVHVHPDTLIEAAGAKLGHGTVRLNSGPAASDTVINLVSSDPTEATVPTSVTILQGHTKAKFAITPVPDTTPDGIKATVTVTASADGFANGTADVQVVDPSLIVKIFPRTISEATGAKPGHGIVFLNSGPATVDTVVTLTSDNTGEATVPTTVTIPQGKRFAIFEVTAVPDTIADDAQTVTVTASADGFLSGSATVNVVDTLPAKLGHWGRDLHHVVDEFFDRFGHHGHWF